MRLGGARRLSECTRMDGWPVRGVYFFFEEGERRKESGDGPRVLRVGTHSIARGAQTTLWNRLSQHRGTRDGGGNHRASVFRLWIGDALGRRGPDLHVDSWLDRRASTSSVKESEHPLECAVTAYIGSMPLLWLGIDDRAQRASVERSAIALLSNYGRICPLDTPSAGWLGRFSSSARVRESGIWNSQLVGSSYDEGFLRVLEREVWRAGPQ